MQPATPRPWLKQWLRIDTNHKDEGHARINGSGLHHRDALIATAERHKLEAEYADQSSQLAHDLDRSRQTTAAMHTAKAAADAEKAAAAQIIIFLEEDKESLTRRMMKILSDNTELHQAARKRGAMPAASDGDTRDKPSAASNAPEYYNIDGHADEDRFDEDAYEGEQWEFFREPALPTKVGAPTQTVTQTATCTKTAPTQASGSRDGDAASTQSRPRRPLVPPGGSGGYPFGGNGGDDDGNGGGFAHENRGNSDEARRPAQPPTTWRQRPRRGRRGQRPEPTT